MVHLLLLLLTGSGVDDIIKKCHPADIKADSEETAGGALLETGSRTGSPSHTQAALAAKRELEQGPVRGVQNLLKEPPCQPSRTARPGRTLLRDTGCTDAGTVSGTS